jgi:hypothetical protein
MENITPQSLIDKGVISLEQWHKLLSAYDFQNGAWYYAPEEGAEDEADFILNYANMYRRVVDALLPENIAYIKGRVFASLYLVPFQTAVVEHAYELNSPIFDGKVLQEQFESINAHFVVIFNTAFELPNIFMKIFAN